MQIFNLYGDYSFTVWKKKGGITTFVPLPPLEGKLPPLEGKNSRGLKGATDVTHEKSIYKGNIDHLKAMLTQQKHFTKPNNCLHSENSCGETSIVLQDHQRGFLITWEVCNNSNTLIELPSIYIIPLLCTAGYSKQSAKTMSGFYEYEILIKTWLVRLVHFLKKWDFLRKLVFCTQSNLHILYTLNTLRQQIVLLHMTTRMVFLFLMHRIVVSMQEC